MKLIVELLRLYTGLALLDWMIGRGGTLAIVGQLVRLFTGLVLIDCLLGRRENQSRQPRQPRQPKPPKPLGVHGPRPPKGFRLPPRDEAVLVAEGQADLEPTLNSSFSACFNPPAIWRRYRRHLEADRDARPGWMIMGMLMWGPFWEGLPTGIAAILGFVVIGSEIPVAIMTGLCIGVGVVWYRACVKMYPRVYADLYVTRNPDAYSPWQSEQKLWGKAVRLCFRDRMNTVFYGSYARGYIRLETNEDISEFTSMEQLFRIRSGQQQLVEAPLLDSHARMRMTEANGLAIHSTRKKSLADQLAQNFGFVIGVICLVIAAYCLLQMQDGEMLGRPDVAERQGVIERMEQEKAAREEALRERQQ